MKNLKEDNHLMFEVVGSLFNDIFTFYLLLWYIGSYILNAIVKELIKVVRKHAATICKTIVEQLIKVVIRTAVIVIRTVKPLLSFRYIEKNKQKKAYLR